MAIFDPLDFFALAQGLSSNSATEASHRTAIGRAYYACHLLARDNLYGVDGRGLTKSEIKRLAGRKVGDHRAVEIAVAQNKNLDPGGAKRLSDQLSELKQMREVADYFRDHDGKPTQDLLTKYNTDGWEGLSKTAMSLANWLLPRLQRLRP